MIQPILACIALTAIVVGTFQLFGQLVYDYRLDRESIRFILFKIIPVWRIPYSEVIEIRPVSWRSMFSLRHPLFGFVSKPLGPFIRIRRNRGILRNVLITPTRPLEFVAAVRDLAKL